MQIQQLIMEFQETMGRQLELLEGLIIEVHNMQTAVMRKHWQMLEQANERLYALSEAVHSCEQTRHAYLQELRQLLGLPESANFSVVLGYIGSDRRQQIASLYRRLKIAVMRIQHLHENIDSYVSSSLETMNSIVEEVFPSMRSGIYQRDGNLQGKQPPAMVVNHHL